MALKTKGNLLFRKINLPSLVVLAVAVSSLVYFLSLKEKERTARLKLQDNLNNVTREKIILEDELKKTNAEKTMFEETISKLKVKMEELTKTLDSEKDKGQELSDKLKEKEKETVKLKSELSSLKNEKGVMESKIAEAEGKIRNLEASLSQLQSVRLELERKLDNIMSKRLEVELEKVVVKPSSPGIARILAVNHSYEFVVINLGRQHGIEVGGIMGIYRQGGLIAKIKIEKVYDMMSVADIIFEASKGIVREEDMVKPISSDVPASILSP